MPVVRDILEQVCPDITITRARYAELLIAEADANRLKAIIHERAEKYQGMNFDEIQLINNLLNNKTSEEKENE